MEKRFLDPRLLLAPALLLAGNTECHAQASSLWNMVKNKVEQKIEATIQHGVDQAGSVAPTADAGQVRRKSIVNGAFDFQPGNTVLFQDDFAAAPVGQMPKSWKTDGSGRVVTLQGIAGKWLELQDYAIYKLAKAADLPSRFTIEFDVVAATDRVDDLTTLTFGLAKDNGISAGDRRQINEVTLYYMNHGGGYVGSDATDNRSSFDFDLSGYANRAMHVSIAVDGDNMAVYLDKTKIADSRQFDNNPVKYFYLQAPNSADHGAKLLVGNFRAAGFQ